MHHHLSSVLRLGEKIHTGSLSWYGIILSFTLMLSHRHSLVIFLGTNIKLEYTKEHCTCYSVLHHDLFTNRWRGEGFCTKLCLYNSPAITCMGWTSQYLSQTTSPPPSCALQTHKPPIISYWNFKLAGTLFLLKLTAYINYSSLIKFNWEAKTINIYFLNQHARSTHYLCL